MSQVGSEIILSPIQVHLEAVYARGGYYLRSKIINVLFNLVNNKIS